LLRKFATRRDILTAEPNAGPRAIASWLAGNMESAIHHPNRRRLTPALPSAVYKINELPGNTTYASCPRLRPRHDSPDPKAFLEKGTFPLREVRLHRQAATNLFGQRCPRSDGARPGRTMNFDLCHGAGQLVCRPSGRRFPRIAKRPAPGVEPDRDLPTGRRLRPGGARRDRSDPEPLRGGERCGVN